MLVSDSGTHVTDDRAVRSRLGPESGSFAVVTADNDESLLSSIGAVTVELERARVAGQVTSFVPLGALLPSRAEQVTRSSAARDAAPGIRRIMHELDFVPEQFKEFWDSLEVATPTLLTLDEVRRSPLAPLISTWLPAGPTPVALIPLAGVKDLTALRASVPAETVVELFHGVRIRTIVSSVVGLAAIFLLLLARYRQPGKVVTALTPAVMACVATVGTLALCGVPLTILHVMSLLLVVSMGVDFGIFFVDTTATAEE
jgi:predicted exporter